ncbi:MAG: MbnP family protein, partial [Flavobacteriales bacterium]
MSNQHDLGGFILVEAGNTDPLTLPGTDVTHAHEIHMALGIDSLSNFNDPAISEAPLNDFTMHWSWNTGYKFVKIEGEHDADMDGTFESFSIHVATAALYREMSFEVMEDLEEGANSFQLNVDYQTLFNNVDFSNLEGTHGASDLTNEVADQIQQNALTIE